MKHLDKLNFKWDPVGIVPPHELSDARKIIHHSVQLIAATGKYFLPDRPDDSHTSLHWNKDRAAFEGEMIGETNPFRLGLHTESMILYIRQNNQDDLATFNLKGNTLSSALSWLKTEFKNRGLDASELSLNMHYEIPPHRVAGGEPVETDISDHFMEIGRYFANAHNVLNAIKSVLPEAGPVRCWPHHFDIATLIKIDKVNPAEEAQTIGIGLSPGDESYTEPYFYISPWPYPDIQKSDLLAMPAGKWHTESWLGAVLPASEICSQSEQAKTVYNFLKSGIIACTKLLNHQQ